MSQIIHRAVAYGVGSLIFAALAYTTNKQAVALPFASKVHAMELPDKTTVVDQRTVGGFEYASGRHCGIETQVLVRSELPEAGLKDYYRQHPITGVYSASERKVAGDVQPIAKTPNIPNRWTRWKDDPSVFVVDFRSPGDGEDPSCQRF